MSTRTITPLQQRMIDDMQARKLHPRTQKAHLGAANDLSPEVRQSFTGAPWARRGHITRCDDCDPPSSPIIADATGIARNVRVRRHANSLLIATFTSSQVAAVFATAILSIMPAFQFFGYLQPVSSLEGGAWVIGHFGDRLFRSKPDPVSLVHRGK